MYSILFLADAGIAMGHVAMGLAGGVAVFLFGLEELTSGLKAVAGGGMKGLLKTLTSNRFKAAFTGACVTAVIQSSSVTTVLVVGFISSGVLSLQNSIGVILGANIGSTLTAQLIAFKIVHYALGILAVGFFLLAIFKRGPLHQYGRVLMGLGFLFLGMQIMSDATHPLRGYAPFIEAMKGLESPGAGILAGALFTAVIQSSAATTGLVIVLAGQGFLSLEAGIAIALGANIGTCATALLAAIGKSRDAVRASLVHVLFNVFGVLIWLAFIGQLADLARWISPQFPSLEGTGRVAAECPRQIANAHTIFNVANTLIFIGFTGPFAWLVRLIVPDKPAPPPPARTEPKFLDDVYLGTPSLALERIRLEIEHLGEAVVHMVVKIPSTFTATSAHALNELREMDDDVDALHDAVIDYMSRLSQGEVPSAEAGRLASYLGTVHYMESIGDVIETDLVEGGLDRVRGGHRFSPEAIDHLHRLYQKTA